MQQGDPKVIPDKDVIFGGKNLALKCIFFFWSCKQVPKYGYSYNLCIYVSLRCQQFFF